MIGCFCNGGWALSLLALSGVCFTLRCALDDVFGLGHKSITMIKPYIFYTNNIEFAILMAMVISGLTLNPEIVFNLLSCCSLTLLPLSLFAQHTIAIIFSSYCFYPTCLVITIGLIVLTCHSILFFCIFPAEMVFCISGVSWYSDTSSSTESCMILY